MMIMMLFCHLLFFVSFSNLTGEKGGREHCNCLSDDRVPTVDSHRDLGPDVENRAVQYWVLCTLGDGDLGEEQLARVSCLSLYRVSHQVHE